MKRIAMLAAMFYTVAASSQECRDYYFLQNNKTIEISMTDKKGAPAGKVIYAVSDTRNTGGSTSATVNSEVFDKKGKAVAKGNTEMKCTNGVLMMDMKMSIPQQQVEQFKAAEAKAENVYMEYPATMKIGDRLKDGHMVLEMNTSGLPQTLTYDVNERTVEAKESVTTAAGTWDCFRISFKSKMNIKMMIGVNLNLDGTEWYAPGFGVVKSQTKNGGSEVTSIK